MKPIVQTPESTFIRVICKKCKNEQNVFDRSATVVKCIKCGTELVMPTGGMSILVNCKAVRQLS